MPRSSFFPESPPGRLRGTHLALCSAQWQNSTTLRSEEYRLRAIVIFVAAIAVALLIARLIPDEEGVPRVARQILFIIAGMCGLLALGTVVVATFE